MSFNVKSISVFERQAKRLVKNTLRLKKKFRNLSKSSRKNLKKVFPLATTATKYVLPLPVKEKVNPVDPVL
jgi:hypothetical protein